MAVDDSVDLLPTLAAYATPQQIQHAREISAIQEKQNRWGGRIDHWSQGLAKALDQLEQAYSERRAYAGEKAAQDRLYQQGQTANIPGTRPSGYPASPTNTSSSDDTGVTRVTSTDAEGTDKTASADTPTRVGATGEPLTAGPDGRINPVSFASRAHEKISNSSLNGYAPPELKRFGINKGTPEEWSRLFTMVQQQESGHRVAQVNPDGSLRKFATTPKGERSYGPGQFNVGEHGLNTWKDVNDPDKVIDAYIKVAQKGELLNYFGSMKRPNETLQHSAWYDKNVAPGLAATRTAQAQKRTEVASLDLGAGLDNIQGDRPPIGKLPIDNPAATGPAQDSGVQGVQVAQNAQQGQLPAQAGIPRIPVSGPPKMDMGEILTNMHLSPEIRKQLLESHLEGRKLQTYKLGNGYIVVNPVTGEATHLPGPAHQTSTTVDKVGTFPTTIPDQTPGQQPNPATIHTPSGNITGGATVPGASPSGGGTSQQQGQNGRPLDMGNVPFIKQNLEGNKERELAAKKDLDKLEIEKTGELADQKHYTDTYNKIADTANESQKHLPTVQLSRKLLDDPKIIAGFMSGQRTTLNKALYNANLGTGERAAVSELFDKLQAGNTISYIKDMASAGLGGKILKAEVEMAQTATAQRGISEKAARANLDINEKFMQHNIKVHELAQEYAADHGGRLGRGWEQYLSGWLKTNRPLSSKDMDEYSKLFKTKKETESSGRRWDPAAKKYVPIPSNSE